MGHIAEVTVAAVRWFVTERAAPSGCVQCLLDVRLCSESRLKNRCTAMTRRPSLGPQHSLLEHPGTAPYPGLALAPLHSHSKDLSPAGLTSSTQLCFLPVDAPPGLQRGPPARATSPGPPHHPSGELTEHRAVDSSQAFPTTMGLHLSRWRREQVSLNSLLV